MRCDHGHADGRPEHKNGHTEPTEDPGAVLDVNAWHEGAPDHPKVVHALPQGRVELRLAPVETASQKPALQRCVLLQHAVTVAQTRKTTRLLQLEE